MQIYGKKFMEISKSLLKMEFEVLIIEMKEIHTYIVKNNKGA